MASMMGVAVAGGAPGGVRMAQQPPELNATSVPTASGAPMATAVPAAAAAAAAAAGPSGVSVGGGYSSMGGMMGMQLASAEEDKAEVEQFINSLENAEPTIPDEVVDYFLARAGFRGADKRLKRIVALAADHFVSSIAYSADQSSKKQWQEAEKTQQQQQPDLLSGIDIGEGAAAAEQDAVKTLTMENLQQALLEFGIDLKRPEYWIDP